jgi:TonB family protein
MESVRHVFLDENERLAGLVPDYWEAWASGSIESVPQEDGKDCHRIKGEMYRGIDGELLQQCEEHAITKSPAPLPPRDTAVIPYKVMKEIVAPKVLYAPDPEYSLLARNDRIEGVSILKAVVTVNGMPTDLAVVRPIGFGLDDQAVATVKTWRFRPATLNGQAVPVRINVEVSFRLH